MEQGNEKKILDATCSNRSIWFQKNEPHTTYCDKRKETIEMCGRVLDINPDVQCDFTSLPFDDCSFSLVVFDPPHIVNCADQTGENSWFRTRYGSLGNDWKDIIKKGFEECMRVLKPDGVLIFKWSDLSVKTSEVIKAIGQEPLFGHRSGKANGTHWMTFMKFA